MALCVHDMFGMTMQCLEDSPDQLPERLAALKRVEEKTDVMQREISAFLTECMMGDMSVAQARGVSAKERITDELESVADSAYSVSVLIYRKVRKELTFHEHGREELKNYTQMVLTFLKYNSDFLCGRMADAYDHERALEMENAIDSVRNKLRKATSQALAAGGDVRGELIFIDIVRHLEHIGDYCLNISQSIAGLD